MRLWKAISLALVVLVLDQLTKWVAQSYLTTGETLPVLGNVVRLALVHNPGGAFGLFAGYSTILLGLSSAVTVAVGWLLLKGRPRWAPRTGMALLWAGTAGNLIDRVRWGYILDFVQVPFWPVFNVADSAIVIGTALIAWGLVRRAN